jgi:hypothetical protein
MAIQQNRTMVCTWIVTWLAFCWFAMQLLHELGHLVVAWWFGVEVTQFHFGLLTISHTMLNETGHSRSTLLAVSWAGAVFGMLAPVALWGVAVLVRFSGAFLMRFLAGFCLAANGCYLLGGLFFPADAYTDPGVLLAHGAMRWQLATVGIIGIVSGFLLWNRQGSYFGIGQTSQPVRWQSVLFSLIFLVAMIVLIFAYNKVVTP